jgi:signal transduction histidine kinase
MDPSSKRPANLQDLADLLETFNDATERLRGSHERLQARVAELSRELEAKNRELARKNRLAVIGEMAACLAHEIRNPLGGIALYAGLLQRDVAGRPEAAALVEKIRAGVDHLNRLVEDMLAFANGVAIRPAPCDPARCVEDALVLAAGALAPRRIRIERAVEPPPRPPSADAALLQRVFLNILLNAAEAMGEEGTLSVRIGPEAREGRAGCAVRFADTGPGIDPGAMEKLFTPFFTRKARGTGLGLSIAHQIVAAHGGRLEASNNPGRGATFTVWIPLEQNPETRNPSRVTAGPRVGHEGHEEHEDRLK